MRHAAPLVGVAAHGLPVAMDVFATRAPDPAAWSALLPGLETQRLTGLAVAASQAGALVLTDEQYAQLETTHQAALAHALVLERQLLNLAASLEAAGITFRVLKGSAVAHLDYQDPALRPFGDCDILIRPQDLKPADHEFMALGYERSLPTAADGFDERFGKGATYVHPVLGTELDVHRTLAMGPFGLSVDLDSLWADHASFRVGGRELAALGIEQRILHACFHATVGNPLHRLQPHRDVAEMLLHARYDEDRVVRLAESWQAGAVVSRAITATWDLWGITSDLPLVAWARRRELSPREERRLAVYRREASYTAKCLECLTVIPRWRDRAAFVSYLAFPDRRFVGAHHPGSRRAWLWHGAKQAVRHRVATGRRSGRRRGRGPGRGAPEGDVGAGRYQ